MNPNHLYPFDFSRGGGAFIATALSPTYVGTSADALLKSFYWHSTEYTMLITAIGLQINTTKVTTPGWGTFVIKKATNISVRNTGGTIVKPYAAPKRTTMMSSTELDTYLEVRTANAGGTGLTKGTRTLSTDILSLSFYSKEVGIGITQSVQDLNFAQGDVIFIENNEGLEASFVGALPSGTELNIRSTLRFTILPNEVVRDYF